MPKSKKTFFPDSFIQKYQDFLAEEWEVFFASISTKHPKSFWVNTHKTTVDHVIGELTKLGIQFQQYDFHPQAFYIDYNKPGDLEIFKKGYISIQEKGAMLPVVAMDYQSDDVVLDACSAPGNKTLQLSNLAHKVVATEIDRGRFQKLRFNKRKFDMENVEVHNIYFPKLADQNLIFDKIILDVPCSSEGLVRKKYDALIGRNAKLVKHKSKIQKKLIIKAFDMLKDGGMMVYSTCSFSPEENEEVVQYLLSERNAVIEPVVLGSIKIRENKILKNCVRLYPQDNDTQQFFLAKIRKM